jgi:hypothetical protein
MVTVGSITEKKKKKRMGKRVQEEEGITSNNVEGSGRTGLHQGRRNQRIPADDGEEDGDVDVDWEGPRLEKLDEEKHGVEVLLVVVSARRGMDQSSGAMAGQWW